MLTTVYGYGERKVSNPLLQPCLRGLRIPVATVVGMIADGMTGHDLEPADITESLRYAAEAVREREPPLLEAA